VLRFATSPDRLRILDGLLRYRSSLHELGLTKGFQWLDGSFMEEIEVTEERTPNDIDLVTFFHLPDGLPSQAELLNLVPAWFNSGEKVHFYVDAYYCQLGEPMSRFEVEQVSYWYSLWSHRRDELWKGFLQIDLDPALDAEAKANLNAIAAERGVS